ncbi:MAG: sporulation initiation factor Spo0A C-terminal domain-containing protein [Eubacterium sp.]|nr:sporulation initiation factor Spo0A C-terminal domain-containing protein [Eubacterium sp.]
MLNTIIDDRLQELGVTKNYKGYYQLKLAIQLALEDDFRLQAVSKEIYKPVAEKFGCHHHSVERNIRTISRRIWRRNPEKLCEIAMCKLNAEPSASELISIIVANIQRSQSVIFL